MMFVIMFVCAGGMRSSLVVSKMQKAAEKQTLNAEIWATGVSHGKEILNEREDIDALLIGPQVRFSANELEKIAKEKIVKQLFMWQICETMEWWMEKKFLMIF